MAGVPAQREGRLLILFVDESGQDHRQSPYEVLGGVAVPQADLWPLITSCRTLFWKHYGDAELASRAEIKANKILSKRRLAQSSGEHIPDDERRELVQQFFKVNREHGQPRRHHFRAHAQSCRLLALDLLKACREHSCRVLAVMVNPAAPPQHDSSLRADYVALFSRLYECVPRHVSQRAIVVHDEREDAECHRLANQLYAYYLTSDTHIPDRIVPEPLFVKSHLTLGITLADVVAYVLAWGFRHAAVLTRDYRPDLAEFAEVIREINGIPKDPPEDLENFGIVYVENLADVGRWSRGTKTSG